MNATQDAVETATAAVPRLYALGSVPASPTYPYGVYSAALGRADAYTLDVSHGLRYGRVIVQTFGKTADSALSRMDDVTDALLDQRLSIVGFDITTPLAIELDPSVIRDPDDNTVIGVTATFTFAVSKES